MTAASWQQHGRPGVQWMVCWTWSSKEGQLHPGLSEHALASRSGKVICPLYLVVRRSHLEGWCARLHTRKVLPNCSELSRGPQGGWEVKHFSCKKKLRDLGSFSLGKVEGHCSIPLPYWGYRSHEGRLFWDVLLWNKKQWMQVGIWEILSRCKVAKIAMTVVGFPRLLVRNLHLWSVHRIHGSG